MQSPRRPPRKGKLRETANLGYVSSPQQQFIQGNRLCCTLQPARSTLEPTLTGCAGRPRHAAQLPPRVRSMALII